MKRNSSNHDTKFSEKWPLNFGLQNVTYMACILVGHVRPTREDFSPCSFFVFMDSDLEEG